MLLDARGFVAETNATHLFFVLDGVLCTPTTDACPEGITRATVLRLAADAGIPIEVGDFSLTQLYSADEAFVTGTMGELTPGARRRRTAHRHRRPGAADHATVDGLRRRDRDQRHRHLGRDGQCPAAVHGCAATSATVQLLGLPSR